MSQIYLQLRTLALWLEFLWRNRCIPTIPAPTSAKRHFRRLDMANPLFLETLPNHFSHFILSCWGRNLMENGIHCLYSIHVIVGLKTFWLAVHSWVGRKHEEKCYLQASEEKNAILKKVTNSKSKSIFLVVSKRLKIRVFYQNKSLSLLTWK